MKIFNSVIGEIGLGRKWANNRYGDMKVKVEGKEITCVKAVLADENQVFKKLIEDEQFAGTLELCEGTTLEVFFELKKYYSGGCMDINNSNVCKILSMCLCYNEKRIVTICEEYIKKHLNKKVIIELCDILHLLKTKELSDLSILCDYYLIENGYNLLNEDQSLVKLKIEGLDFILLSPKLVIENETWLFKRLLKWYENQMKNIKEDNNKEELKTEFLKLVSKFIHFDSVDWNKIENKSIKEIENINFEMTIKEIKEKRNYYYINLYKMDEKIKEIIMKYFIEEEILNIEESDIEIMKENNIYEIIDMLLENDDIKINMIGLLIILDSKVAYELSNEKKSSLLLNLLCEYKKHEDEKIIKCLVLFIDCEDDIKLIKGLMNDKILFKVLNYNYCLSKENKQMIIDYVNELEYNDDELENMIDIVYDERLKEELKYKKITKFEYPQSEYEVVIDDNFSIKPKFASSKCRFSINPILPSGLSLNEETGEISGKIENEMEKKRI